jgi:hypothetical protein
MQLQFFYIFPHFFGQMAVDRKSLCILAETEPASFKCVVDEAKRQVEKIAQGFRWSPAVQL